MNYDRFLNPRAVAVPPSGIRRFFDLAATMKDAISLGVGEPDFITPYHIRNAAINSIVDGETQYTPNRGLLTLRQEISRYLEGRYHTPYDPDTEILVTVGASESIDVALRAMLAAITPRTKALILPYPTNPTGAIMTRADLEALAEVVREHEIMVVSDEIYSELTYGGEHVSFASLPGMWDYTLTINGFSKSFAMTGWRVGYICGPAEMIAVMNKIHQYGILCAPRQALRMGRENGYEDVQHMRESYDRRRRLMVDGLRKMGLHCFEPRGAFYVFPSIKSTGLTSEEFCERLLQEQHVACVPGTAFGPCGEGHIRCSYATAVDKLNIALEKMEVFLRGL